MTDFPWRSLVVLALLGAMYGVSVVWLKFAHPQAEAGKAPVATESASTDADQSSAGPGTSAAADFTATLGSVMSPWVHVPPVGHMRPRFESDLTEFMPAGSFNPTELFALGAHGRYVNPQLEAAWQGWRLSLVSLSLRDQFVPGETITTPVTPPCRANLATTRLSRSSAFL